MEKKKLYYICSPYRADSQEKMKYNQRRAEFYRKIAEKIYGCRAIAPHSILPNMLDDNVEAERNLALRFGLDLLEVCDGIIICENIISEGMKKEIEKATELGLEIKHLSERFCGRTPYLVSIIETLSRDVIVYAEDKDEAEEIAEELCNNGVIDLDGSDFEFRYMLVNDFDETADKSKLERYFEEDIV